MAETSQDSVQEPRSGLTTFSKVILALLGLLWTLVIVPLVVGVLTTVITLPKNWATNQATSHLRPKTGI